MCGSRPLRTFCDQLADQLYRYRQISVRKIYPRRDLDGEHQTILAAIVRNDADAAVAALLAHYRATTAVVLTDLPGSLAATRALDASSNEPSEVVDAHDKPMNVFWEVLTQILPRLEEMKRVELETRRQHYVSELLFLPGYSPGFVLRYPS